MKFVAKQAGFAACDTLKLNWAEIFIFKALNFQIENTPFFVVTYTVFPVSFFCLLARDDVD